MQVEFICNNKSCFVNAPAGKPALDIIRNDIGFKGCREGCREGECGACAVLLGSLINDEVKYISAASCLLPAMELQGRHLVSVEGTNSPDLTPLQQIFVEENASQCGFCTPGFLISLTQFFFNSEELSIDDALTAMDGNICRCTGYGSIRRAAERLCERYQPLLDKSKSRLDQLIEWGIVPAYFSGIAARLAGIKSGPAGPANLANSLSCGRSGIISGGTDLYIGKGMEAESSDELISLRNMPELNYIQTEGRTVKLGGAATVEALRTDKNVQALVPSVKDDLTLVSSAILRSRASVAGNLVNASPIADLAVYLLPFKAQLVLDKIGSRRRVSLNSFFKDYKVIELAGGEIIAKIEFDVPENYAFSFLKTSRRKYLDIASVNSAVLADFGGPSKICLTISAGGLGPIPYYFEYEVSTPEQEGFSASLVEAINGLASRVSPISDVRGEADYKRRLFKNQLAVHFGKLFPDYFYPGEALNEL